MWLLHLVNECAAIFAYNKKITARNTTVQHQYVKTYFSLAVGKWLYAYSLKCD
ncbi:hypothetical protein EV209_2380 [Cuneatibacter caecimuris]|uniref:Uncharacterized protein n=1 Tax=Cuneatibacter caecimuris TaxID=1796618 RepID=A0A4Q7P304_9FIRM|nr:hypothetical protein EV209_2380 [Cuneatibacter caecimuris]